jgi:hypothetical protein
MGAPGEIKMAGKHTVCIGAYSENRRNKRYNPTILVRLEALPWGGFDAIFFFSSCTIATAIVAAGI